MPNQSPRTYVPCPAVGHDHALTDLTGRTAVVTGGAAGIGYYVAEGLAAQGAHVVLAGRDAGRADAAASAIRSHVPGAQVSHQPLDLADLGSVRAAADSLASRPSIDLLVANAGAIGYPDHSKPPEHRGVRRQETADGHEFFWGTNFLGHYLLLAALLPKVLTAGGRGVLVGSIGDRGAPLPADAVPSPDLDASDLAKYGQSKLATTTLMTEVARRVASASGSSGAAVLGAHPGTAVDFLSPPRAGVVTHQPDVAPLLQRAARLFAHGKHHGALPVLTAAACPDAQGGDYWGPRRITKGRPVRVRPRSTTQDPAAAGRLVAAAARLTGQELPL